jgi:hypothetical protein
MEEELQNYGACDPIKIQEKKRAVVLAKEAAVRWTGDHVYCVAEPLFTLDYRQLLLPQGPCSGEQPGHSPRPSRLSRDRRGLRGPLLNHQIFLTPCLCAGLPWLPTVSLYIRVMTSGRMFYSI